MEKIESRFFKITDDMTQNYSIEEISRLAILFVEQDPELAEKGEEGYNIALKRLESFSLRIDATDKIKESISLQAAIVTAINTGKRAFKGGVFVNIPENIPLLLPWNNHIYLNDVVEEIGGKKYIDTLDHSFSLCFGCKAENINSLEVVANAWQGGVVACNNKIEIPSKPDGALGGIFAGAFGTALAFLRVSKEKIDCTAKSKGISLWRPDLNWTDENAIGPKIENFPKKIWLAGLGHLGQAFVWLIGLFAFKNPDDVEIVLQDTDIVTVSNYDTGLLSDDNLNIKKTRICSLWLENRRIKSTIIERLFDENVKPQKEEADILLCGLDKIEVRRILDVTKFKRIVDCGIGGNKSSFDSITVYNFPSCKEDPKMIWELQEIQTENPESEKMYEKMWGCGNYDKGIGTAFIGAITSSIAFSEILRAFHKGKEFGHLHFSARSHGTQLHGIQYLGNYGLASNYSKSGTATLK